MKPSWIHKHFDVDGGYPIMVGQIPFDKQPLLYTSMMLSIQHHFDKIVWIHKGNTRDSDLNLLHFFFTAIS